MQEIYEGLVSPETRGFKLEVPRPPLPTEVVIGQGILDRIPSVIDLSGYTQFVIVTEERLESQFGFGSKVKEGLGKTGKPVHIFTSKGSERNKTEEAADRILAGILRIEPEIDRKLLMFDVGGGVMGDVTGYDASRVLRGVDYCNVPTTLLAMVDSAHGGKTGVDFDDIKNRVGTFHLSRFTVEDIDVLEVLPKRQITSGFAEFVKHAFLDENIFKFILGESDRSIIGDRDKLIKGLELSAKYKLGIVSQDYEEKTGVRQVLNLGHTFGHALETGAGLEKLTHGEAVAIGLTGSISMSYKLGLLSAENTRSMIDAIIRFGLPRSTEGIVNIDRNLLWKIMASDKKAVNGVPKFTLLEGVGRPKVGCLVDKKIVDEALDLISL